jgi:ATP-dependent DNA helicase RecG
VRSKQDIADLLDELEHCRADDLEDQDLDFKEWNARSTADAVKTVVEWAVCMANGGGGTVVFGVRDNVQGRAKALEGVPLAVEINRLRQAVYDQTDPKLTPVFEELHVPEGTGRLILMQVYPGMPPYTDTKGQGRIRVGKTCQPLTGTLRRNLSAENMDYTAETVDGQPAKLLSPSAMEVLRNSARAEHAPEDLLAMADLELMRTLGLVRDRRLTRAAVLLGGTEQAIRDSTPGYAWTFLHMTSDSQYDIREDRVEAIALSVARIEELILPFNPITTHAERLFHYEYHAYPITALREGLMNAFCHADWRIAGPVLIKLFADHLEISNNGGFIGGITAQNILHHQPAARNPLLVNALVRLRLVNRSNLGVSRMFGAFLMEGKKPPAFDEAGESVRLVMWGGAPDTTYRKYVAETAGTAHGPLEVDELIVLDRLRRHPVITLQNAAHACQRSVPEAAQVLQRLQARGVLRPHGADSPTAWTLATDLFSRSSVTDKGKAVETVLEALRAIRPQGLRNAEVQTISGLSRSQVKRMMRDLQGQGHVVTKGNGPATRYFFTGG